MSTTSITQKGIQTREVGYKYSGGKENLPEVSAITLNNVHTLSTYELRQELKRRGKDIVVQNNENTDVEISAPKINHRTLLKRLVQVLYEENEAAESKRNSDLISNRLMTKKNKKNGSPRTMRNENDISRKVEVGHTVQTAEKSFCSSSTSHATLEEKLKQEKANRKALAIQRSIERQKDKDYFKVKREANEEFICKQEGFTPREEQSDRVKEE